MPLKTPASHFCNELFATMMRQQQLQNLVIHPVTIVIDCIVSLLSTFQKIPRSLIPYLKIAMASKQRKVKAPLSEVEFTEQDIQNARQQLLSAVEDHGSDSPRPLLELFFDKQADRNQKHQKQLLLQAVEGWNKAVARRFFAALSPILLHVIEGELYVPESAVQENSDDSFAITPDDESSEHLQFLQCSAWLLQSYVDALAAKREERDQNIRRTTLSITEEAFQVAEALHSVLLTLQDCGPDAAAPQSAILSLCEAWWHHSATNAAELVPSALSVLVQRALDPEASQVTLKRLFGMRQGFLLLDFDDADSADLRKLLMRVASSPVCLKQPLGRRFVAHLLQIKELVHSLHQAMKVQIAPKKIILDAYGDIYFRAWKEVDEEAEDDSNIRSTLETHVLSELCYAAVHAESPSMAKSLLTILKPFHEAKTTPVVEDLLYNIYNPILFRALDATHAQIRIQATRLLSHVFPLQDASHTQTERCLTKSVNALERVLVDEDPRVRVAASAAVAQVLSTYWQVVAPTQIRALLNRTSTPSYCIATVLFYKPHSSFLSFSHVPAFLFLSN